MDDRRVALLRGVNIGPAKRVAMADLRKLVESLGFTGVRTVLNSGNVVFTERGRSSGDAAARIERAIHARLGVATRVIVMTGREIATAVRDNPLVSVASDPSRLLVMVAANHAALARLQPLLEQRWEPEALALGRRVAYLWCPEGVSGGRLWEAANRTLGDSGTARNLATMTKLLALVEGPQGQGAGESGS